MSERRFVISEVGAGWRGQEIDLVNFPITEAELKRRLHRCFGAYADNKPMNEIIDYLLHGEKEHCTKEGEGS